MSSALPLLSLHPAPRLLFLKLLKLLPSVPQSFLGMLSVALFFSIFPLQWKGELFVIW
ncbi:hypothetical protein BO70DRAFT_363558 [Aspergillus heteromorphus CBS 117.55]|uniref:Uncharacterized protein n=1 Tax=Aspergillus heteromorphus CBS 117.55 TaxID=1448321 RepID=A0A317VVT7_9EURO|nr:uncharacterized protein BO70DRAFT_363558 [Aspergillus heteromorphus CBS 117.55]PWY77008.1 hypothetical protein BO70DRAFT_363558 [Aspergillus heteromorphus CBS 117.55]